MKNKLLYLIRHAKAEEYSFAKRDYDRDITENGIIRATEIANSLTNNFKPAGNTLVISSTANRAIQTAKLFCNRINYPLKNIQHEKSIYEAFYLDILQVINRVPDTIGTLLVFGHNPGLSDLTNYLTDSYIDLKTSHAAVIALGENMNFAALSGGTATLKHIIT